MKRHFAYKSCELFDRECARTGTKSAIMVRTFLKQKQEMDVDGDEPMEDRPDWSGPVDAD